MGRTQFACDLAARRAISDDEHGPRWCLLWVSVAFRRQLHDIACEILGNGRDGRVLKGTGCQDDGTSEDDAAGCGGRAEDAIHLLKSFDIGAQRDREIKVLRIRLEV